MDNKFLMIKGRECNGNLGFPKPTKVFTQCQKFFEFHFKNMNYSPNLTTFFRCIIPTFLTTCSATFFVLRPASANTCNMQHIYHATAKNVAMHWIRNVLLSMGRIIVNSKLHFGSSWLNIIFIPATEFMWRRIEIAFCLTPNSTVQSVNKNMKNQFRMYDAWGNVLYCNVS